jgi:dienelactone hydrolase
MKRRTVSFAGRRRVLGLLMGSAAVLGACGGDPGGPRMARREDQDEEFSRFSARGYDPAVSASAISHREVWPHGDDEITLNFLIPQIGRPSPLVIYLPGLGESADAGESWRQAWAHAGYAVVAAQTTSGTRLWSSERARNGDFKRVAQEQFSARELSKRVDVVTSVLAGISRRARSADGVFERIDATKWAVAGFDLGAQTAMALAGEKDAAIALPRPPDSLRAVVAISPLAFLAKGGFAERFGDIRSPVLSITATEDEDPSGLVESPYSRQAPFKYMPQGGKYLLVLEDATHQVLAGSSNGDPRLPEAVSPDETSGLPGGPSGPYPRFGGGMGGPMGSPGGMGGMPGRDGPPPGMGDKRGMDKRAARALQRQLLIVQRISVAFLDATVKGDSVAREWLERDAERWSDPLARFSLK